MPVSNSCEDKKKYKGRKTPYNFKKAFKPLIGFLIIVLVFCMWETIAKYWCPKDMNQYTMNIHFIGFETYLTWEIKALVESQGNIHNLKWNLEFTNNVPPNYGV